MHITILVLIGMVMGEEDGVAFIYDDPGARNVFVSGSFNGWAKIPMVKEDGVWKAVVKIPPGRYEYKFIVDENWIQDPDNPVRSGTYNNSVFIVKEDGRVMIPGEGRVFFSGYMNFISVKDTLFYGNALLTMRVPLDKLSGEFQVYGNTAGEFEMYRMKVSSGPFFIFYNYPLYSTNDPFYMFGKEKELEKSFGEGWEGGGMESKNYSLILASNIETQDIVIGIERKGIMSGRFGKRRKEIAIYHKEWGIRGGIRKDADFIEGKGKFNYFSFCSGYMRDTTSYLFSLFFSIGIKRKNFSFSYGVHHFWSSPSIDTSFLYSFPHFDKFLHFEEPLIGMRVIHQGKVLLDFPYLTLNIKGAWSPNIYVLDGIYRVKLMFLGIEGRFVIYPNATIFQPFVYLSFSRIRNATLLIGYGFDPKDELGEVRYWKVVDKNGWKRSPYLIEIAPNLEGDERRWEIRADFYF